MGCLSKFSPTGGHMWRVIILCCAGMIHVASAQADSRFPADTWDRIPSIEAAVSVEALADFESYLFDPDIDEERGTRRTDGVVVIKDGRLVYERYARGYDADTRHLSWSMAKSFMGALYGIAQRNGFLDINDRITIPADWDVPPNTLDGLSYRNLLQMSSGIRWREGYEFAPLRSSVIAMLYTHGRHDMGAFVANNGLEFVPGARFKYSSGDTNLLSALLKEKLGDDLYQDYPWRALFDPIGMTNVAWEQDASGTFVGSSYLYATPQDYARFGLLMLNDGVWRGNRLLPEGWVDFSCTVNSAFVDEVVNGYAPRQSYGAQWWLNAEDARIGLDRAYLDTPTDACMALGHWRQVLAILPSHNMVVVRVAHDQGTRGSEVNNHTIAKAIATFHGSQ